MKRVLTALVLMPVTIYVVLWANFWVFLAVLVAVACLCYREYADIAAQYAPGASRTLGFAAGLLLLVWEGDAWLLIVALALIVLSMAMRHGDLTQALPGSALLFTGVIYTFGCWKFAMPLRSQNPHWLLYALVVNWAGDAGAYYVGRKFGRHKMAPRVSPQKSWEGAAASVVTAVLVAGAYVLKFVPGISIAAAVALTVAANAAGQLGDLAESAMKRGAHVKDSGALLPGHGGFLDRVDSTLFALPVIYAYVKLVG
ncbi:MAG TPA: phosphatidate cytidylyltransferase [Bryobacteraceae bacterium]|jgi:phosphatidate cytidylyltransferase